MALSFTRDLTRQWKQSVYHLNLDVSGWDTVNIQVVDSASTIFVYGSSDNGQPQGQALPSGNYGAQLAQNFTPVQAVNLATGSPVTSISSGDGIYSVPVNFQFLRLAGADVYSMIQNNIKVG